MGTPNSPATEGPFHEQWKYEDPNEPDRGILLADQIHQLCKQRLLISEDYKEENLRPAAYTLRIGDDYIDSDGTKRRFSDTDDSFVFKKNSIIFVSTKEKLELPYYVVARFNLRVNWVYGGILLGTGPQVDPGFSGKLSCPLYNLTSVDILIRRGEDFATIDFEKTTSLGNKTWEKRKELIEKAEDKKLLLDGYKTWSFYKLPPMAALQSRKPYEIVSSLIAMKNEVDTWRKLGIGSLIAFFGLTVSLLAVGANLYRLNADLNRQVTENTYELRQATTHISNLEGEIAYLHGSNGKPTESSPETPTQAKSKKPAN